MKRTNSRHILPSAPARGGTTLTEVLVSLLVMSIGVVTLATLFPISVLRSVQATQMTNATMLRYNAESMLELFPHAKNVAPLWKPNTEYFVGNFVVDDLPDGRIFQCTEVIKANGPNGGGMSGGASPFSQPSARAPMTPINDPADPPSGPPDPALEWELVEFQRKFVIDPLGWNVIRKDYPPTTPPNLHDWFGNSGTAPFGGLKRFNLGNNTPGGFELFNERQADRLVTLPDSWVEQARGIPVGLLTQTAGGRTYRIGLTLPPEMTLDGIPFSEDLNLNGMLDPPPPPVGEGEDTNRNGLLDLGTGDARIRITDITGRYSFERTITFIDAPNRQVYWTEDVNDNGSLDAAPYNEDANGNGIIDRYDLPLGFNQIGEVIIETRERRYSWMLTVRRKTIVSADVDVVVFFRRAFDLEEERVYSTAIGDGTGALISPFGPDGEAGVAGVDDDGDGDVDERDASEADFPGSDDRVIRMTWPADAKPFYKRGTYIFDVGNALWYQIIDYDEFPAGDGADFTVDRKIKANSDRAMLMRSVIEVFSLGSK